MDLNRDGVSEIFSRNLKEQQWTNNVVPTAKNSYNCYEASNYKDKLGFLHWWIRGAALLSTTSVVSKQAEFAKNWLKANESWTEKTWKTFHYVQ